MKSYFTKKLQESDFDSRNNVLITGTHKNPQELLLPYLFSHSKDRKQVVVDFGENQSKLHYLCKRISLELSKMNNISFYDMFSAMAESIENEYPLTVQPPYSHKKYSSTYISANTEKKAIYLDLIEKLKAEEDKDILILNNVEFMLLDLEDDLSLFFSFYISLCKLGFSKVIVLVNRKVLNGDKFTPILNMLYSQANYTIDIIDLESGYSKDLSGNIEFSYYDTTTIKKVTQNLKFNKKMSRIVFFEQYHVN